MPVSNDRVFNLVRKYRYNPRLFSEQQVDQLQQLADENDIPFNRKTDEFNLRGTIQQLASGFLEGFTTIPVSKISGDVPKTTYEEIAHSLGHLGGFAPGIMAFPLKAVGLKGAAKIATKANHWSVPMVFGDKAQKAAALGLNKVGLESYDLFKKGASTRAILDQAVHLGTASAVSSVWKGPDEMMNAGVYGAVAGGAFGGLGEIKMIGNYLKSTNMKDYRKGEQRLKSAIGASMLGIPTAMEGAPVEMVMYQTLLGGFFGYKSRPAHEAQGGKFIADLAYNENSKYIFHPDEHPDFHLYSKKAQDYIYKETTDNSRNWLRKYYELGRNWSQDDADLAVEELVSKTNNIPEGELPTKEQLDYGWRKLANETFTAPENAERVVPKEWSDKILGGKPLDLTDDVELNPQKTSKSKAAMDRAKNKNVFVVVQRIDADGKVHTEIVGGLTESDIGFQGNVDKYNVVDKYENKPADVIENTEYITFDGVFLKTPKKIKDPNTNRWVVKKDKDGGIEYEIKKFKPLDTEISAIDKYRTDFESTSPVDKSTMWGVEVSLDNTGRYIFGGTKNKGTYSIRRYHDDINKYTMEKINKALVSDRHSLADIRKIYLSSLNAWAKRYPDAYKNRPKDLKDMHDKAWMSNVLVTSERNGFLDPSLKDVHNITRKGFVKNVIDFNKREQLWQDKSSPLPKGTLGGRNPFIIVNDVLGKEYQLDTGEFKKEDSDHDGTVYFYKNDKAGIDDIQTMQEALGRPGEKVNMNKPVIVSKIPGYGTLVLKAAGAGAPPEIQRFMDKTGVKIVIMKSAAKHTGNLKVYDFDRNLLKQGIYELTEPFQPHKDLHIKDTDIRINMGTYENPKKFNIGQKIVRQLSTNLSSVLAPNAMNKLWEKVYLPNIDGNKDVNKNIDAYVKGDEKAIDLKTIHVDDIGVKQLHDIFVNHGGTKLAKKLAKQIVKMDTNGELEDIDTFSDAEFQEWIYKNNRILINSDLSQSQREMGLYAREFFESNYKKYLLHRYVSPRYKNSAKAWLAPRHPHDVVQNNVEQGKFMLGKDAKNMSVTYKGKEMTLGEAWKKAGESGKSNDFDFLIIRVPSDSISGTRVLKFDGFTKEKGISLTTNAKDNMYLGGADKDSDTAFIYQDMPREVIDAIKNRGNKEWEKDGKWVDGKSRANDRLFDSLTNPEYESPISQFSPSFRRDVAETAARGQNGLGFGLTAKMNLLNFADYISETGGVLKIPLISKKGNEYGFIEVKLKPNNESHEILTRLGREIVNRSADASNYSQMLDYAKFRDLLVNEAFDISVKKMKDYSNSISYAELERNSVLKTIAEVTRLSSNKNTKNLDILHSRLNELSNADLQSIKGLTGKALLKMKQDGLHESFISKDTLEHYVKQIEIFKEQHIKIMEKDPILKRINQMHYGNVTADRLLNPQNIRNAIKNENWSWARVLIERDMKTIASWNALNKKGYRIYKALKDMNKFKDVDPMVDNWLRHIANEATTIKKKFDNRNTPTEGNPTHSFNEAYDREIAQFNDRLKAKVNHPKNGFNKKYGKDNKLTEEMLLDYFHTWLLSPFYRKTFTVDKNGVKRPFTSFSKMPYQSRYVHDRAIKGLLKEQDTIFDEIKTTKPDVKVYEGESLFDINKADTLNPKPEIKLYKERIYDDDLHFLRSRALNDKQYKEVLDFEKTLNNNKFIKDNLKDFFESFTEEILGAKERKDFSLMNIKDIIAMNRSIKDMDIRTDNRNTKLPDFAWRASPEYMDLFMRRFEERFFISSKQKVKTRDGTVMREVKKYTSTMGDVQDYLHKIITKMESQSSLVMQFNDETFPIRGLVAKEARPIHDLVVDAIEGKDYKSKDSYLKYKDKIFELNNRKYTLEELIQDTRARYKQNLEKFSKRFIHSVDNKGNFVDFKLIDQKFEYKKYNDLLRWKKNGEFDIDHFIEKVITDVQRGKDIPKMQLETILRAQYEYVLEAYIDQMSKISKLSKKELRQNFRQGKLLDPKAKDIKDNNVDSTSKGYKFPDIGKKNLDKYFPHGNFGADKRSRIEIEKWKIERAEEIKKDYMSKGMSEAEAEKRAELFRLRSDLNVEESRSSDAGGARTGIEDLMKDFYKIPIKQLRNLGQGSTPQSAKRRTANMPGWDRSEYAIDHYKESFINSVYKNIAAFGSKVKIDQFQRNKAFGKNTKHWSLYLRSYVRDSLGLPSVFGDDLKYFEAADQNTTELFGYNLEPIVKKFFGSKFKRRGVYAFSDEKVIEAMNGINNRVKKKFGRELPFMKDVPDAPNPKLLEGSKLDRDLFWAQHNARMEALTRWVHRWGRYEAKWNLWSILATPKVMTGNLFGGTTNTITRGGLKNLFRANNKKYLTKNIIKDTNGDYRLQFEDGKFVKDTKDLNRWISEKGIIESFIANELNLNISLNKVKGRAGRNLADFAKELAKKIARDPDLSDRTVIDIAKKYRVDKLMDTSAAWFMQTSERKLRRDAFLTHAIEYMEHFGKDGYKLGLNDPAVFEAGMRGVEASQFIYHSSFRPGYMRTSLGKVLSRFKLFVFNSVRIRKEMLRKAKYYGFKEGTKEFDKFKNDFQIQMFVMALGTAYAFSLFDTTLPPPYDWIQETGDWLLGDKETRDKAFFGQYPYPIAPLNIITPPVARIPNSVFSSLINKDWERFFDYHVHMMYPFGRMIRSIDKTIDEPYGTLEGRAMQQFFGIPLDKMRSNIDRAQLLKARKQMIDREMEELYGDNRRNI